MPFMEIMKIKSIRFNVIAKPSSKENNIHFDKERNAYIVQVKAKPEDNKANIEIIRFLSKLTKKRARIVSGLKSKEKIVELV